MFDPAHTAHDAAHRWFEKGRHGSPAKVAEIFSRLLGVGNHIFWPEEISLFGSKLVSPEALHTAG